MVREVPPQPTPYPAEKARGGKIILNTPARRTIFLAGLVGAVLLALVLMFVR
ncbi:MAG: peptide ABC transporter permease [Bradyrhizobium sp.]|nr:peptide ABC transporter permease [Bradyrhizobium sp.]